MLIYERELDKHLDWAVYEGGAHFEGRSAVQISLADICKKLDDLQIPYAVAGAMAMFLHGYRRFTEDVDMVVTREGLDAIHKSLEGRGYLPVYRGGKNMRDTSNGVRIKFLVTREYPGDGRPQPVSFPDPAQEFETINGIRVIGLEKLIELKLASGMAAHRIKDLGDVQEIIKVLKLPKDIGERLDPYVRDQYLELWQGVADAPRWPGE